MSKHDAAISRLYTKATTAWEYGIWKVVKQKSFDMASFTRPGKRLAVRREQNNTNFTTDFWPEFGRSWLCTVACQMPNSGSVAQDLCSHYQHYCTYLCWLPLLPPCPAFFMLLTPIIYVKLCHVRLYLSFHDLSHQKNQHISPETSLFKCGHFFFNCLLK